MPNQTYDNAPSNVREAISESARLTGVSEELLAKIIGRESGFNPNAANRASSAQGLGQHLDDTWAKITTARGARYGITPKTSRFDARASALMTAELANENARSLRKSLGRAASPGEIYAAHFLGAGRAAEMIAASNKTPGAAAADLFADAAKSNRSIFFDAKGGKRSISAVLADLTATAGEGGSAVLPSSGPMANIYGSEPLPEVPQKSGFAGLWDNYKLAAEQEQSQVMIAQYLLRAGDASLAPDDDFRWSKEKIQAKTSELPEDMANWVVENAHSDGHADLLVKKAKRELTNEASLAELGMAANLGLRGAAILTDIPTWFIGAGAGKLAGGARLGKLAMAGRAGLIAAAENAPLEAIKMKARPNYGVDDALLNTTSAFAFGAGFGAVFGHSGKALDDAFAKEAGAAERYVIEKTGKLTSKGEAYYAAYGVPGPVEPRKPTSGGSMATPPPAPASGVDRLRIDVMGGLMASPSYEVRELAQKLDLDAVGDGGASVRIEESAFEYARRTHEAADALVSRTVNDAYEEFAQRNGLTLLQKIGRVRDEWNRDVARHILDPDHSADPSVIKAADAYRPGYDHWLQRAKAEGAEWAQEVTKNDIYFPMIFDRERVRAMRHRFDDEGIASVVRQALRSANDAMTEETAQRVAEKYVRVVRDTTEVLGGARANALSGLDREGLVELLTQQGLDPADAEAFVAANKGTRESGPGSFRRKTVLNDLTKFMPDGGKPGDEFSIRDLTDLDAERVWEKYNRSMAGHVAMVRAGFQTRGQFEGAVEAMTKASANGLSGMTDTTAQKNQKALLYLGRQIYGVPDQDLTGDGVRLASIFSSYNFSTMMGQSGVAQLGDIPKILLKTSMEASLRAFRMGDVLRVLSKGGVEADVLARDLEVMTGVGTSRARGHVIQRYSDIDDFYVDDGSAKALRTVQKVAKTGANVTALVSGMTPVTDFLGRWAVRAHLQHLVDITTGKRVVAPKILNDMGLGKAELTRLKALVDHMDLADNGVVQRINRERLMEIDPRGVDILAGYLSRQARLTILETSPGMLPEVMGTTLGRLALQFRSFSMASHAANTLHNLKMGNAYAAKSFLVTGAWSTALYALHTYGKSLGRSDAEEYRERTLNPSTVLTSGFLVRSADSGIVASVLGTAWDFSLAPAGIANPLNQGRTTGLESGLMGIPTVATGVAAGKVVQAGVADASTGSTLTQQDAARIVRLVPLNNAYGISNAMRAFVEMFPDRDDD